MPEPYGEFAGGVLDVDAPKRSKACSTLPSLAAAFGGSLLAGPPPGDFSIDGFQLAGELPGLHRLGQAFGKALLDVLEFLHRPIRVLSNRATSTGVPIIRAGDIDEASSSPLIIDQKSRAYLPRRFSSAAALAYSVKLITPVSMHF